MKENKLKHGQVLNTQFTKQNVSIVKKYMKKCQNIFQHNE